MDAKHVIELEKKYMMNTYARLPLVLERGEGMYVWDANGKRYLDMVAGIAVLSLGHSHPAFVSAVYEQASTLVHTSNLYYTAPQTILAERLISMSFPGKVFFANSGAEANEAAFKLARKSGRQKKGKRRKEEAPFVVISAYNSFHGRTLATLAATGQPEKQKMFEPMPEGFVSVEYNDTKALQDAVDERTCAVILEPIQGEGGVIVAEPGYLKAVRELCDREGLVFILDEVQTGIGRTGQEFAYKPYNVSPDVMTLAKGLGGGFPIGAMVVSEKLADTFAPGDHGTTFGGSPLACGAAIAVLTTIEEEGLVENARKQGEYLIERLSDINRKHDIISEIRGRGLMIGIKLKRQNAAAILADCLDSGVIINKTSDDVIRLLPPLIIKREQIDEFASIFESSITKTSD